MHANNLLPVVARAASILLVVKGPGRLFPLIALVASSIEVLRAFGILRLKVPRDRRGATVRWRDGGGRCRQLDQILQQAPRPRLAGSQRDLGRIERGRRSAAVRSAAESRLTGTIAAIGRW
jgi:hypothetical protein